MEEKQIKTKLKSQIQIMLDRLVRTITNIMIYLIGVPEATKEQRYYSK